MDSCFWVLGLLGPSFCAMNRQLWHNASASVFTCVDNSVGLLWALPVHVCGDHVTMCGSPVPFVFNRVLYWCWKVKGGGLHSCCSLPIVTSQKPACRSRMSDLALLFTATGDCAAHRGTHFFQHESNSPAFTPLLPLQGSGSNFVAVAQALHMTLSWQGVAGVNFGLGFAHKKCTKVA